MTEAVTQIENTATRKLWLDSYPAEMPEFIPSLQYSSLKDFLERNCAKHGGKTAYSSMGKAMTFAELDRVSANVGGWLQSQGLKKGDRVAVMLPNILQYPAVVTGILRAGMTVVNVNPLYTPRELEHQLNDSGATAIFILENFATTLQQVVSKTSVRIAVVASMGDLLGLKGHIVNFVVRKVKKLVPDWSLNGAFRFKEVIAEGKTLKPVEVGLEDIAFLQYTGGTTGVSKGATLSHANLLSNIAQIDVWFKPGAKKHGLKDEQVVLVCALPLYHIFALTVNMFHAVELGGLNILIANPRDIPAFVKEIKPFRFNVFPGLNTLFNALATNDDFKKLDFSGLMLTLGGGMAMQKAVAERWESVTGCWVSEGYGLSETSPVATSNRTDGDAFTGTVGLPLPSTEVEIRDEDGNTLPVGEPGEICIRGPQVMVGYWNRPEETAKAISEDGFFRSGDIGVMLETGYIKIVDRKKDMILVSGFNVFPNEIEEYAVTMPGVLECAAIGVPDEHSGETVKLFVVKSDEAITEADVKAYCAKGLTNYKRPKYVEFRDSLPKSNVGKILRKELRS
ncbi:long-chain-fatty-acid--CoA ligase [Rhizobium sp. L1K21]|uniref:long-chain-fatty-acid--CoA ligase n=1 Tax=Rhizobium sp. L1K21 TaxID=2954933 RepID=UPI0020936E67|nr:long-chain-fatty-acid--CoA ligase [Rhizobium sp. L1K21]MCO6187299.1 long-chain-fatty-acid--CoA ligase [Rhizobium sp. L1K21]